jgi:hypothetical protein
MNGPSTGSDYTITGANAADFALASNNWSGSVGAVPAQSIVRCTPSKQATETATLTYTSGNATSGNPAVALSCTGVIIIANASNPNLLLWQGTIDDVDKLFVWNR